jgi:hypothetical protein
MSIARFSKKLVVSTLAVLSIMLAVSARGQSGDYNGFYWSLNGNTIEITGNDGSLGGAVAIPSSVPVQTGTNPDGSPIYTYYPVTSIGDDAFLNCTGLTNVTIPNSVTTIGEQAFEGCSGLTSVTIGTSVTSIGDDAFAGCSGLTNVTIPNSVTSIGDDAFAYCTSLTSVRIGTSVTSIGEEAFWSCTSLTSVTIPDSVTSIGEWAFWSCTSLTSVMIGTSVTSIGDGAFAGCSGLTNVTIPKSVTNIGYAPFIACYSLTAITVDINNPAYSSVAGVLFDKSQTTLIEYPEGIAGPYTIPDSATSIGDNAFLFCTNLTSVTIPNSVTSIGDDAFSLCTSLTSVTIPNSVTSIGDDAFSLCTSLTSVTIPNSVTSIGGFAFWSCSSLTNVCFEGNEPSDGGDIFQDDPVSTIYYVNGTTGWGTTYDGIPTAPCTQCPGSVTITGQVTCTCDGSPITNASVQIGCLAVTSDGSGNYSITAAWPGTNSVTVSAPFYSTTNCVVTIPCGVSAATQNFTLTPNALDNTLLNAIVPDSSVQKYSVTPSGYYTPNVIMATFTPQPVGRTLATAACKLGYDHFNWYQEVTGPPYVGKFLCGTSLYFADPPQTFCNGNANLLPDPNTGTPTWPADSPLALYWNENNNTANPYNLANWISPDGTTLSFQDQPFLGYLYVATLPSAYFITHLVGVKSDGTWESLKAFQWSSTYHCLIGGGCAGGITLAASLLQLTNGTGGTSIIQTNVLPSDIPPDAVALMLQGGGSFPVTIQPQTLSVPVGGVATLSLVASSSAPFNYQWRRDEVNLAGATSATLTLSNITDSEAGIYDAILSDANGSIGSAPATLTVGGDSVGDGIPDAWRAQYFPNVDPTGMTTGNLSCATCDADGTGQNNLLKYLVGLDPTNPASVFRITSLVRQGNNIAVSWQAGGGRTNLVQTATSMVGSNNFNDSSPAFILPGSGDVFTNWVDTGGATNSPTRFYRVRLLP